MSTRPINLLEIKSNFHKANTEMNASFETIWNDLGGRVHNLNDTLKVRDAQLEGMQAEITRLRNELAKLNGEAVVAEPDNAIDPPK